MSYEVHVDKDVCMSSGKCVSDAPAVFRFDEDEIAEVTGPPVGLTADQIIEIARNCPSGAITVLDGGTEVPVD